MPSSLTGTLLVALLVILVIYVVSESLLAPQCDNGKMSLDKDLPASAVHWDCPESLWPGSAQGPPTIIDTWYDPEPARQICMDESISYNHTIPNSGAFRPVRAESGEYLSCPPQRWLNNLYHAAIVLLYHPCAPLRERLLLSTLARSCLLDYVMTPHKELNTNTPIVLVSWGHTLELSTGATLDVCDWLETTTSTRNKSADLSESRSYNLFLTWSAETHRKKHPEENPAQTKELLRQCCEQTISSLLNRVINPQVQNTHISKYENWKPFKDKGKTRRSRASMRKLRNNMDADQKENTTCVSNRTSIGDIQNCTVGSLRDLPSENRTLQDNPETASTIDSLSSRHPELKKVQHNGQKGAWKLQNVEQKSSAGLDFLRNTNNSEHNHTTTNNNIPEQMSISSKDKVADPIKLRHKVDVDVKERELKQQQTLTDFDFVSKSKLHSLPHPKQQTNPDQPRHHSCAGCQEGEHCECTRKSWSEAYAAFVYKRLLRNDEALWAAAALGFLLVLLTLSVLHTRLYRNWRTSPSVYWHDPKQDYDTVADVIHRRVQIAKRRLKRGRRKECIFIPSSSSSDELP